MGFFQRSVNVHVDDVSLVNGIVTVREAIVTALASDGWTLCDDDAENVGRTMLIAPHSEGWVTLIDDAFAEDSEEPEQLMDLIKNSVAGPFVVVAVDDNLISDLVICERNYTDHLLPQSVACGWSIPDRPPWTSLLTDRRLAFNSRRVFSNLDDVVDAMGLDLVRWMDLAAQYEEDQTEEGAFLRLRGKRKPRKGRVPTAPVVAITKDLPASEANALAPNSSNEDEPSAQQQWEMITTTLQRLRHSKDVGLKSAIRSAPTDPNLVLPAFLSGDARTVLRRWKKIMATLLDSGSWAEAMKGQSMVSLETNSYALLRRRNGFSPDTAGESVFRLIVVPDALCDAAADNNYLRYSLVRSLMLEGMNQFWMCLTMLGNGGPQFLPWTRDPSLEASTAVAILRKYARWWDELCSLEGRFYDGESREHWPDWAERLWSLMVGAGVSESLWRRMSEGSAADAGILLKSWLEQQSMDEASNSRPG